MPASMYLPIKYYLQPTQAPEQHQPIAAVLHVAHHIRCMQYPEENVISESAEQVDQPILDMIKVSANQFPKLADSAAHLYDEALSLLGL